MSHAIQVLVAVSLFLAILFGWDDGPATGVYSILYNLIIV